MAAASAMRPATIDVIAHRPVQCETKLRIARHASLVDRNRAARAPYPAEIGLVGRSPGKYNLYLGAAFDGSRLNKLYRQNVGHDEIVAALSPLIERYAKERVRASALATS